VHFFGAIDEAGAADALRVVTPIAARTTAFDMALDRFGTFPSRGAPRVLWLGPSSDVDALTALAADCSAALAGTGFEIEHRPYHAHCTLGRPRFPWSDSARAAWTTAATAGQPEIRFTASRLVLFESRTAPGGAVYVERSSVAFAER
jgi:2'-5' RNA ligase